MCKSLRFYFFSPFYNSQEYWCTIVGFCRKISKYEAQLQKFERKIYEVEIYLWFDKIFNTKLNTRFCELVKNLWNCLPATFCNRLKKCWDSNFHYFSLLIENVHYFIIFTLCFRKVFFSISFVFVRLGICVFLEVLIPLLRHVYS